MNAIESDPLQIPAEVSAPTHSPEASALTHAVEVSALTQSIERPTLGSDLRRTLRDFFHGTELPYRLALVRICLAFTLLFPTVYRWFYSREIFSTDGAGISLWSIYGHHWPWLEPTGTVVVAIHSIAILALITSCVGWCTRLSLILATVGYTYVNMLDILGTLNKSSAIASHILFFLCFTHCGAVWSVDSWLARRRLARQGVPPELVPGPQADPRWPRRLIQLLLATVYLSAAVTKLSLRGYFTGEHLQTWMLSTIHTPNLLGGSLALHPSLVIVCAYVTVVWELLFIFLVWKPVPRRVVLGLGVLFHVMTCLTLGLFIFPMICLSAYATFATDSEIEWVRSAAASWRDWIVARLGSVHRLAGFVGDKLPTIEPAWSQGAFLGAILCTGLGGVALEYKLDRFGLHRPEGRYQLQEVDPQEVAELLTPTRPIKPEDKVLNFDIGSIFVGGSLLDRRTTFHQGETVRAQCGLIPPHESIWIQCNLHDSQNRVVDTNGLFLSCDMLRALFYYNLGDCVMPGDYSLVLKIAGDEIMRRKITVLPRTTACSAN
jgi:hypothetical protein